VTSKRPTQRKSSRTRRAPAPLERVVPLRTANEVLPHDALAEERRRLLDDVRLRERHREVSDALLPIRDVSAPAAYEWDDMPHDPEPPHDRTREVAREDIEDRGES